MLTNWIRSWWGLPARTSDKFRIHRNRLDSLECDMEALQGQNEGQGRYLEELNERVKQLETATTEEVVMTGRTVKIERRLAKNGEYYFVLLGGNGEVVVASETYDSKSNCDRARDWLLEKMKSGVAELSEE